MDIDFELLDLLTTAHPLDMSLGWTLSQHGEMHRVVNVSNTVGESCVQVL